jgi:magnesium chelatase subunit I
MTEAFPDGLPRTLGALRASGWVSRSVKAELRENLIAALERQAASLRAGSGPPEALFPGVVGYDDTVIPAIVNAVLAGHDMLFLGEKGQGKSRLMRMLGRFLDPLLPCVDMSQEGGSPIHEDPYRPITRRGRALVARLGDATPIAWWRREDRYAERLAPGTKFADVIDPARLMAGVSMSDEESIAFGLVPRMHRGIFAMNELPDLDDLVQVGLFNILEERDVQVRGLPVKFDVDVLVLFSANPTTYNRSGKVIPQLKDRIGSTIQTHYPRQRDLGIAIMEQEALGVASGGTRADGVDLGGAYPLVVPRFMKEIVEEMAHVARASKFIDHASGVSARFTISNFKTMLASARRRAVVLGERPGVPRISDLAHARASSTGKLELDLLSSHQMSESQTFDAVMAEAIKRVFGEYVTRHGLDEIAGVFAKGVRLEVGDTVPSAAYEKIVARVPKVWDKALEANAATDPAVRASCVEFVLAGMWASDLISRAEKHGRLSFET